VAGAALLAGCSGDDGGEPSSAGGSQPPGGTGSTVGGGGATDSSLAAPGSAGLVDEATWQARIDEYLAGAAADPDPSNASGIVAALIAAHRDPNYTWDPTTVTVAALQDRWDQIDGWQDTRDFALMYLHWILALADGSTPMTTIDPSVLDAIEQRLVDNRYRYDDPLPADRLDEQWFWSENHIVILLTIEYLAGQRMPDRTFTITGLTGAEHMARAKPLILAWVDERARFGFFEWHSHVYMKKNVEPLATLIEWCDDPELVQAAAMALDLCVLDMAGHCHAGSYTASRGRTYAKDKTSTRESTYDVFKLLFDDTEQPYQGGPDAGVNHLAGATRYRPPQALLDVATGADPGVTRERHGLFVDSGAPIVETPEAPYGFDFDDPDNLEFWWSQGAIGLWQLSRVSLAEAERFRLLETKLMEPIRALVALNDGDPDRVREWVRANRAVVNFGHLQEANTYAWRGDTVAMATVLDHRFGEMRDQIHTWQAAVDTDAFVFTTHPAKDLPEGENWSGDDKPGYWTGEASVPRSAQHERTAIHIYQPAWDETNVDPLLWTVFGYQPYTHAFVPQERFDDVVRDGSWTFARKGDGYIALWSWRAPEWRTYDPAVNPTDGMTEPFDLVAPGGADNVWIVEVGDATGSGSFDAFMTACKASEPAVTRDDAGFTVGWTSPSAGEVAFGSTAPFMVGGAEQALGDHPRHESKWATIEREATTYDVKGDTATLTLDFDRRTRAVAAR
jgi:hypothetical protein